MIEYLNNSNEYFEELYCFFIISDTEKRRAILVACCLNNFYDCYASLQTFLNFLITKKQNKTKQERNNSQDHLINHQKSSKEKGKRNPSRFWIRPVSLES